MIGSPKNRKRLAAALREAGFSYAWDTSREVVIGKTEGSALPAVFSLPTRQSGGYLRIRGTHKDKSRNIDASFEGTLSQIVAILTPIRID